MKPCRTCQHPIAEDARACPNCGAPFPAKEHWDGHGFEYKSTARIGDLPLIHISLKYRANRAPVPARGVIAIGQFAIGVVTISQFGVGLISVSQFTVAGFAVAQFAAAWSLVAQIGVYVQSGVGQRIIQLAELF